MNRILASTSVQLCAGVSLAILAVSLIPQMHLWAVRGSEWNGTYATMQGDEFLYSAYVNALVDGRPRRNDPFAGRDSTIESPLPESSFSIQFVPPYLIAFPARVLGISTSTAFIVLTAATAVLASCSVFWLLSTVTTNPKIAAAGVLIVLCLGELAGDQGIVGVLLLDHKLSVLVPYLRRYQPALALPLFFVFCTLVYRALSLENNRRARIKALLAGLTLVVLVFSYLYMWTAAAAWLACICALWIGFRSKKERRRALMVFGIAASMMILALIPYAYLITTRSKSLDDAQIMVYTRQLDLFHPAELIGAVILIVLIMGWWYGKIKLSERPAIFTASLAILPFIVFNQQLLTGRSMQPFHFDLFVVNYAISLSSIILLTLFWRSIPNRLLVWVAAGCFTWGLVEMGLLARGRAAVDGIDDQAVPVLLRLNELAKEDGIGSRGNPGKSSETVFSPHVDVMRILPTWSSQGSLLGAGAQDFGTATRNERKELLFLQLYYSGIGAARFRDFLNQRTDDRYMNFYAPSVVFGDDRFIPALTLHYEPIQQFEIEQAVREYEVFTSTISLKQVLARPITYLVIRADDPPYLSNLDHWYDRDRGERFGDYTLFRLTLRS